MKMNAVVLKFATVSLRLTALALLFLLYSWIVFWVEDIYSIGNSDFTEVAIVGLALIPITFVVLFQRLLKRRWITSRSDVLALGVILFVGSLGWTWVLLTVNKFVKNAHERDVIASLEEIHRAQIAFKVQKYRYATLKELVDATFLNSNYLNEKKLLGYQLSESGVFADKFCVHADRVKDSMGNRDFLLTESGEIRYIETRLRGTVQRGQGKLLYTLLE